MLFACCAEEALVLIISCAVATAVVQHMGLDAVARRSLWRYPPARVYPSPESGVPVLVRSGYAAPPLPWTALLICFDRRAHVCGRWGGWVDEGRRGGQHPCRAGRCRSGEWRECGGAGDAMPPHLSAKISIMNHMCMHMPADSTPYLNFRDRRQRHWTFEGWVCGAFRFYVARRVGEG